MENYATSGVFTPSTWSYVVSPTSFTEAVGGVDQRRLRGDVRVNAGRQHALPNQGITPPVATRIVPAFGGMPTTDVRLVKSRSGSRASALSG